MADPECWDWARCSHGSSCQCPLALHRLQPGFEDLGGVAGAARGPPFLQAGEIFGYRIITVAGKAQVGLECESCGCKSTDPSPFLAASNEDEYGGARPWARYQKDENKRERKVYGKRCMICNNVFVTSSGSS